MLQSLVGRAEALFLMAPAPSDTTATQHWMNWPIAGAQQLRLVWLTLAIRLRTVQVASLPTILSAKRTSHMLQIFLAICELIAASF